MPYTFKLGAGKDLSHCKAWKRRLLVLKGCAWVVRAFHIDPKEARELYSHTCCSEKCAAAITAFCTNLDACVLFEGVVHLGRKGAFPNEGIEVKLLA